MRAPSLLPALLLLAACAEVAEAPLVPTWERDVAPIVARCATCHDPSGARPVLADLRDLACGDDGAPIAPATLARALARDDHAALLAAGERDALLAWADGGALVFASPIAHAPGFAVPSRPESHAATLRATGYAALLDGTCARCHGLPPERGGAVACATCHDELPASEATCDLCHGRDGDPQPVLRICDAPARKAAVGAHDAHRHPSDPRIAPVACNRCHVVPANVADPGHLDAPTVTIPGARWDAESHTCSAVPCHLGATKTWTATATARPTCARCHGAPPAGHPGGEPCARCHAAAHDASGRLDPARHLDGVVQVATACDACHGAAPAFDHDPDPGAHRAHLAGRISVAIDCATCHQVPSVPEAPEHLDGAVRVTLRGQAATARGALTPTWSPATRTCANVGCHGANLAAGARTTSVWSASTAGIPCGGCHALPPPAPHLPTGPAECGACHRTAAGAPITEGTTRITAEGKAVHAGGCVSLERGCR